MPGAPGTFRWVPVGFTRSAEDPSGGNIRATDLNELGGYALRVADAAGLALRLGTILPGG